MASKVVVGVYKTQEETLSAIRRLHEAGYTSDDISVLAKNPERFDRVDAETPKAAASGAATGAVTGGVLGGAGALLASLGVLAIPGIGPFLAAGPIAATLGGIVAGSVAGGIVGALVGLGIDKGDAEQYEHALNNGDLLVLVKADVDRFDRVHDIFLYPEEEYYRRYDRMGNPLDFDGDGKVVETHPLDPQDRPFLDKAEDAVHRVGDAARRTLDVDNDGKVIEKHPFDDRKI